MAEPTRLNASRQTDCAACALKANCCPGQPARKVPRSVHEAAREAVRRLANSPEYVQSRRERKKVEMLFAHLKRILRLNRLRLRGPSGAKDEFLLAAIAQNLRKVAKSVDRSRLVPCPWDHSRNERKARTSEPASPDSRRVTSTADRRDLAKILPSSTSSTESADSGHW